MKYIDAVWFSGPQTVGLIKYEVDGKVSYTIGAANTGLKDTDVEYILAFGAPFPTNIGEMMFGIPWEGVAKVKM
jgi:hypothetical protein